MLLNVLQHYFEKKLVQEAEHPAYKSIREHLLVTFHPDSAAMRSFEQGEEDGRMELQEETAIDEDGPLPFAGLDAPLGE